MANALFHVSQYIGSEKKYIIRSSLRKKFLRIFMCLNSLVFFTHLSRVSSLCVSRASLCASSRFSLHASSRSSLQASPRISLHVFLHSGSLVSLQVKSEKTEIRDTR